MSSMIVENGGGLVAAKKQQQDNANVRTLQVVGGRIAEHAGKTEWTRDERQALFQRVYNGDKTAVPELRAMFVAHPDAAMRVWSPARTQRYALAQRSARPDDLLAPELAIAQ